ncbi:hypothetical protein PTSG_01757 [Salpingoeca rosetta]|uniref:Uncharacterized protein n=1 Tax=Salpingoeca rosetta (strain ATCC 50818 / BSB-021) TaxID=946362 RepID=F2TYV7_SALR5|nr:uncharacterized protein PTSG_01757 [Salpingoeca rosetta]EGD78781.1 hypothetical protein PTSG_01757 [Salpingoeca rosetta]|eukprot:XP_004997737.1 hypothetical protein PTSG_01757 [Salpingoeca rosetta]
MERREQEQQDEDGGHEEVTFVARVPNGDEADTTSSDDDGDEGDLGAWDTGVEDGRDDEGVASTAGYIPLMLDSDEGTANDDDGESGDDSDDDADADVDGSSDGVDDDADADGDDDADGNGGGGGGGEEEEAVVVEDVNGETSGRHEEEGSEGVVEPRQFTATMAVAMQIRAQGTIHVEPVEPQHARADDFALSEEHIHTIKACMASFSLPCPPDFNMTEVDTTIQRVLQRTQHQQEQHSAGTGAHQTHQQQQQDQQQPQRE